MPAVPAKATPSQNVTINLINRLVERGVLAKEDAVDLIKQAEEDAIKAREQSSNVAQVLPPSAAISEEPVLAKPPLFPDAQVTPSPLPPEDDPVRVAYIPPVVVSRMRDEIKADLLEELSHDKTGTVKIPDWVPRFRVSGDIRVRYDGTYLPSTKLNANGEVVSGNDNTGAFPNFNSINTGAPFDVSGNTFAPQTNVDQDRNRFRLRLRIAAEVDMGEGFSAGIRIATGENNSPVSTNQSFGLANNGQGGDFSKYSIWLDRAYLRYQVGGTPERDFSIMVGRFDNPFFNTEIVFDDDVGFDGVAITGKYRFFERLTPFITAGAFPVFNTDFNFSSNQPAKFKSEDKYLYAAQIGTDLKVTKDLSAKLGVAYYHYDKIEGRLSSPFTPLNSSDQGDTDGTRPSFAQKGNTYRPLRNIVANASNNFGTTNQFQYFGLATPFHELSITARLDYNRFEPFQVSLIGEYVKNLAFNGSDVERVAINNRGANTNSGSIGSFSGGDTAWIVGLRVGHLVLEKRWDWNAFIGYRYVESDAVVDGLTDSDFGLGGTNVKGYTVGATLALGARVNLGLRWLSADSISGPPFKSDVLQVDVNGKF